MVRIFTDSAADFEPAEYEKLGVTCIPLYVYFGDDEYRETVELDKDSFYRLLTESGHMPRTSQPSPYDLEMALKQAMDNGDEAVAISLSSTFSGFCRSLFMTKTLLGYDKCHIVDGLTATGGQRLLVEYAAKLRDAGENAASIAQKLNELRPHIALYACIDTLEYLRRGGRISNLSYTVGSIARIKPIITVDDGGNITIPAKAMGMRKGMDYMLGRLEKRPVDESFPLYVMYTANRDNARILAGLLEKRGYVIPPERLINVGAAIGSHIGPNGCGIVYVAKE